ncbi:MAG: N-acetyltransferase [Caldilineaceae bacterium]
MTLTFRNYVNTVDKVQMLKLAHSTAGTNLHLIDLPYRLSSWTFDHPANVALWHDKNGALCAWAALQTPFWALDYCYLPDDPTLHPTILAWADEQARKLVTRTGDYEGGRPCWFVNVFPDQTERIADLEQFGFACQSDVGENSWSKLFMRLAAVAEPSALALPAGFSVRPLAGEAEASAYVALHQAAFQSKSMTIDWRKRTLQHPAYRPNLDLVVEASNGELAAFCICWFTQSGFDGQPAGQIEPLGVAEQYHRHGLGRAILLEGIRRLRAQGAQNIYVETDNYRDAAMALYEAVGFRVHKDVLVYRKDYA